MCLAPAAYADFREPGRLVGRSRFFPFARESTNGHSPRSMPAMIPVVSLSDSN
jgi:hypothetical protein